MTKPDDKQPDYTDEIWGSERQMKRVNGYCGGKYVT
jgi:hypothetical protein